MSVLLAIASVHKDPETEQPKKLSLGFWLGILAVGLGTFTTSIDERLATTAQPDLVGGFGYGNDPGSWIQTAYDVGEVVTLAASPWLGQILSVRRFSAFLLVIGALAAAAGSSATGYGELMTLRTIQGIGDGGMLPMMLATVLNLLPKSRKALGVSIFAFIVVLAAIVNFSIEGVYASLFVWRTVFWTTVVAGPVAAFLILTLTPGTPVKWGMFVGTDHFAVFALAGFAGCLAVGLDQGQRLDWFDSGFIDATFFLSIWLLFVFVGNEIATGSPLYKLHVFARPSFAAGTVMIFLAGMSVLALTMLFPEEQIAIRGLRPLQIGDTALWLSVSATASLVATPFLLTRLDARMVATFAFALVASASWACVWVTPVWDGDNYQLFLQIMTFGYVMAIASTIDIATGVLSDDEHVTGAVMLNLMRTLGFVAGAAILRGILVVRTRVHSDEDVAAHLDIARQPVRERLETQGLPALDHAQTLQSQVMAFADAFGFLAIFTLCALLLILLQKAPAVTRRQKL